MSCNFAAHLGLRVGTAAQAVDTTSSEAEIRVDDKSKRESASPAGNDIPEVVVPTTPDSTRPSEPTLELVIAFCAWAHDHETFPTTDEVVERVNVTAWDADRWRRVLAAEYGVTP